MDREVDETGRLHVMICTKSSNATRHGCARYAMEKEKIQNSCIGSAPVVLLVLSYLDADLLTRPWCQHIFLLSLKSSLTYQKLSRPTQKSSAFMNPVF